MNLAKLKEYYKSSPKFLKSLFSLIPWELRMGKEYRKTYEFLVNSSKWSFEKWRAYQEKELRSLVKYCYNYVPYYQRILKEIKFDFNARDFFSEFKKIPLISKKELIEHGHEFLSKAFLENQCYHATTGGTTGKPTNIYYDKQSYKKEWAFKMFLWKSAIGYTIKNRKATFRGVEFNDKLYIENPIYNEIRFSPFKIDERNTEVLIKKIMNYSPEYIHGYPSAIYALAKTFKRNNLKIHDLKGIMLISENIYPYQKELIEEVFEKKIYSFYGHSERLIIASMLDDLNDYYIHPAYGYLELLDEKNVGINGPNIQGEIVGTGFINRAMPLLRFKTGDFGEFSETRHKEFNFLPLQNIKGRWLQEYIIGKNDERFSMTALNMHSNVYDEIDHIQFFQDKKGLVILNVVKSNLYDQSSEDKIRNALYEKVGNSIEFQFNYLGSLEKTIRGKAKYLIQKINVND